VSYQPITQSLKDEAVAHTRLASESSLLDVNGTDAIEHDDR
jgi:hypothetical protein